MADDGVGFDPKELTTCQSSFGLEVMRERAAQIGGEVRINTAPGRGTMVTITIPRFAGQGRTSAPASPGVETGEPDAKIRVLLADDHILFMEGLRNLIGPRFEVVGTARDGLEALEKACLLHLE